MKRKKAPKADLEEITPELIALWRRLHKLPGPPDRLQTREFRGVVDTIKALQEQSWQGQSLIGQDFFIHKELLGAYLLYNWVIHYQEGLSLIGELPHTPGRVLDICSGPLPFAYAALKHGAREVIATDWNDHALQLGAEMCGRGGYPVSIRKWNALKGGPLPVEGKFDLIILGHCLQDLFPDTKKNWREEQKNFIQNRLNNLTPDGFLLIVDSSLSHTNRRILELRDQMVGLGVPVQAPCVWKGECVALKSNSLCFAQREMEKSHLIKEFQRAAAINLSSLKMSYLILRNPNAGWPQLPEKPLYRIISPPIDTIHGKRYYLCGTDGKKNLGSNVEPLPKEARAFEFLRRGELISFKDVYERDQIVDIVDGSEITVDAALGKPLPERDYGE